MLSKFFRKKTSVAEIEAIANRSLMQVLLLAINTSGEDKTKSLLESSRLLRVRAEQRESKLLKAGWFKKRIQCWIGLDVLQKQMIDDMKFMGERFNQAGDVSAKYNTGFSLALMAAKADELDRIGDTMTTPQDKQDMNDAALSVRQLAGGFIDDKSNNKDNDD